MTEAQRLLTEWRHLIEPVTGEGAMAVPWEQVLGMDVLVRARGQSVLVTVDGELGGRKTRTVWVAAGDMADVLSLVRDTEAEAAALGCTRVAYLGRHGWHKVAPGYKVEAVLGVKEI